MAHAFASQGERVLLAETAAHGVLGFHFGLGELRPGSVQVVAPREGVSGAASLASYEIADARDERQREDLAERLLRDAEGCARLLLDLVLESIWLVRRLANLRPVVLAPVAPDLNSVIGVREMERIFNGFADPDGRPLLPFYVLNRFDAGLPLHLDIREVLRLQLGERLLPAAVRSSPTVSEALAEGRTVAEYAPEAPVARDYAEVARWLKGMSAAAVDGIAVEQRGDR
jgi:cellulose biosynthesis protein BcsQ